MSLPNSRLSKLECIKWKWNKKKKKKQTKEVLTFTCIVTHVCKHYWVPFSQLHAPGREKSTGMERNGAQVPVRGVNVEMDKCSALSQSANPLHASQWVQRVKQLHSTYCPNWDVFQLHKHTGSSSNFYIQWWEKPSTFYITRRKRILLCPNQVLKVSTSNIKYLHKHCIKWVSTKKVRQYS